MPSRSHVSSVAPRIDVLALGVALAMMSFGCAYQVSDFTVGDGGTTTDTSIGGGDSGKDNDTGSGTDTGSAIDTGGGDVACSAPMVACSGVCTDLANDTKNCGKCGNGCDPTQRCAGGKCKGG